MDEWLPADAWAPGSAWDLYRPEAIRLFARVADADPPAEGGATYREWPWPTGNEPAWIDFQPGSHFYEYRCAMVAGDEADAWCEAPSGAKEMSRFASAEHHYQVTVRLIVPDEPAKCPER